MRPNIVAVIVTFNRLSKLKLTIEKTLSNDFYKVVVVNNCSTDGTLDWLNALTDERLEIIHCDRNLGGAGGFNRGFAHAASAIPDAQWLVCFDDDAYPEADVLDQFHRLDIPDDVGSIAGAVYLPSGGISEMNRPSRNPFWHLKELFRTAFRGRSGFHVADICYESTKPMDVDTSSFVGCFLRLSLIRSKQIGLPRSELFLYADDIIYVLELRKAGFRHWFAPTLRFKHDCETLINQQDVYHPLWKAYYVIRNRLEMYRIASGIFYPLILLVKIPSFFLACPHYERFERIKFLVISTHAIWDGLRRDYSKSHKEVTELCAIKE